MALINIPIPPSLEHTDSGLRIEHNGKEKAILIMKQTGQPEGSVISSRAEKKRKTKHGWHSDTKKIEAATLYAATGSPKQTAKLTGVPEGTITRWMQEEWWLSTMLRIRREENTVIDQKFTQIVDKALEKMMDRIEGGDYVYDIKRGVSVPVPVSARDLAIVTGTIFDKRQLLRGEATSIKAVASADETLKSLARQFEEFVTKKEKLLNAVEAQEVHVLTEASNGQAIPESKDTTSKEES